MSNFELLLRQLQEEHDREVSVLREQIMQQGPSSNITPGESAKDQWLKVGRYVEQQEISNTRLKALHHLNHLKGGLALARKAVDVNAVRMELRKQMGHVFGEEWLVDGKRISLGSRLYYRVENMSSVYSNFFFNSLILISVVATVTLGLFWQLVCDDPDQEKHGTYYFMFDMFQLIASGGIDDSIRSAGKSFVFTMALLIGLLVFAVLVGIITEHFQKLVESINQGKSQVVESGHTLLLGWNESTERVVCQLAFIRRQFILANSSWDKRLLWWTRVAPSTPVAKSRIVIMCADKTKEEMHDRISRAFAERGISPKRTRVGFDVICRVGDPTNPQDLLMMGAHRAVAIAMMLTSQDMEEEAQSGSLNGVTFRTLLAVRSVLFSDGVSPPWEDIRIVVPLTRPSRAIHSAAFSVKLEENGTQRQAVLVQDLSLFVNTLMMTCATQPGLSDVLMDLMSFDGDSLRLRRVKDFPDQDEFIGKTFQELTHYWDNAILVGVAPAFPMHADEPDPDNGMAPAGSRKITPDDRLIFVSTSSVPTVSQNTKPPAEILLDRKSNKIVRQPQRLLTCGFRPEWRTPNRFANQMRETLCHLAHGSSMQFLNMLPEAEFESVMQRILLEDTQRCFASSGESTWTYRGKVEISHTLGDAAQYNTVQTLLTHKRFDCVIIVPPVDSDLSPQAQDTRLMSIMCIVRSVCDEHDIPPPHIIGENKLETTAHLALRPRTDRGLIDDSDFVNVQAIIARALCQALAYPFMQPPLVQLLSAAAGTPSVHLCSAGFFLPYGEEIAFADIVRQVKKGHEDDICIGYRAFLGVERRLVTKLAPNMRDRLTFHDGDTLVLISRHDPDPLGMEEPPPLPPFIETDSKDLKISSSMPLSGVAQRSKKASLPSPPVQECLANTVSGVMRPSIFGNTAETDKLLKMEVSSQCSTHSELREPVEFAEEQAKKKNSQTARSQPAKKRTKARRKISSPKTHFSDAGEMI